MLRWHTFRIVLVTSLVWILVGLCVLVYYNDCWGDDGNCIGGGVSGRRKPLLAGAPANSNQAQSSGLIGGVLKNFAIPFKSSSSPLPPYTSEQLKFYEPAGELSIAIEKA